ncbi:MAG TPA: hypothetical protein VMT53_02325 [Terriglobales bacterium]|nr:hypothetical protein [Terriglobales bacterium]
MQLQLLASMRRIEGRCSSALGAIATDFEAGNNDMKAAIPLDLAFQSVEQIALEFSNAPATQAGHMDVIAPRTPFIEMLLALEVHEVKFIHKSMALQQAEGTVNSHAIDIGINLARSPQDLGGVQMLLRNLDDRQDSPALASHAQAARHEFSL